MTTAIALTQIRATRCRSADRRAFPECGMLQSCRRSIAVGASRPGTTWTTRPFSVREAFWCAKTSITRPFSGLVASGEHSTQEAGALSDQDKEDTFNSYFAIFPWHLIGRHSIGADIGCGSGRWAQLVAPRVGRLLGLRSERAGPGGCPGQISRISPTCPLTWPTSTTSRSMTAPSTLRIASACCITYLIRRAPSAPSPASSSRALRCSYTSTMAFDNRAVLVSSVVEGHGFGTAHDFAAPTGVRPSSPLSSRYRSDWPLARTAALLDRAGKLPSSWPLAHYRDRSLYVMRTDLRSLLHQARASLFETGRSTGCCGRQDSRRSYFQRTSRFGVRWQ